MTDQQPRKGKAQCRTEIDPDLNNGDDSTVASMMASRGEYAERKAGTQQVSIFVRQS